MQRQGRYPHVCFLLFIFVALAATGCSPRPVEVLSVSGPDSLQTNEAGTFEAVVNEEAKPPITYRWEFGDVEEALGNPATHRFERAGTYTVAVTASNRKGKSTDTGETSVVVINPPVPAAIVTVFADPTNPEVGEVVHFGSNVRGDVPITYRWTFGDGASAASASPSHTFERPGVYEVVLDVSNGVGSDQRSMSLSVESAEASYCAEITEMNSAFFDRNSSVLSDMGEQALRENLQILEDCPSFSVRVEGWASPNERNTQSLSTDRARAVQQYYIDNGVAGDRIRIEGRGAAAASTKKSGANQYRRADTIPIRSGL